MVREEVSSIMRMVFSSDQYPPPQSLLDQFEDPNDPVTVRLLSVGGDARAQWISQAAKWFEHLLETDPEAQARVKGLAGL